jgi:hypothetical protein
MSISPTHCITQNKQFFTRSPVLIHMHVHSTDLPSHYVTHESHLEFIINSCAQRRLIHHLHLCSHDDAPNTLGFHTFTLCSTTSTPNSTHVYNFPLHHIFDIRIFHLIVFRSIMKHWVLKELYTRLLVIIIGSIS